MRWLIIQRSEINILWNTDGKLFHSCVIQTGYFHLYWKSPLFLSVLHMGSVPRLASSPTIMTVFLLSLKPLDTLPVGIHTLGFNAGLKHNFQLPRGGITNDGSAPDGQRLDMHVLWAYPPAGRPAEGRRVGTKQLIYAYESHAIPEQWGDALFISIILSNGINHPNLSKASRWGPPAARNS